MQNNRMAKKRGLVRIPSPLERLLENCKRLQADIEERKPSWIEAARQGCLPEGDVIALLAFVYGARDWKESKKRKAAHEDRHYATEQWRWANPSPGFNATSTERSALSQRGVDRFISLVLLGYLDRRQTNEVRKADWEPIAAHLLEAWDDADPQDPFDIDKLKKRIRRKKNWLRDEHTGELPIAEARLTFKRVYTTFNR